jgi:hypothetical protein
MRRYADAERRRAVKDFECGGISASEFCGRRGMSSVILAQWRRRYSGNAHSVPAAVPPWLPVVIADAGPPTVDPSVVYVMIAGTRRPVPAIGSARCSGAAPGVLRGTAPHRTRMHRILPHLLSMNGIDDSGVPLRSRKSLNSL